MRFRKYYALFLALALVAVIVACTANQRAKQFGGKITIDLPQGKKLVTATWKETNLWYLTRPMRADEQPEEYVFQESSDFGVMEGQVIFREHR